MERDGTADVAHLHMGTASPKKNPLLVNKGFGSPHGIRPHRMQGDLGEFGTYEMATEKEHSTSYSEMSKAVVYKHSTTYEKKDKPSAQAQAGSSQFARVVEHIKELEPLRKELFAKDYKSLKASVDVDVQIKAAFSVAEYRADVSESLLAQSQPSPSMQAMKYKIEAFTPAFQAKYAKDTKTYAGKKTLCLDLRDIMMVSTFATENADEIISLKSEPAGTVAELSIKYRPHMHEFLEDMASKYELIVYSNFSNRQVQAIADCVEKRRKYFAYRFHDEFCLFANISSSVKCLDFLYSNRSLADIILVDARAKTLPLTVDNFVPLPTFSGDDPNDTELVKLAAVLDRLAEAKDVAAAIRGYRGEIPLST